MRNKNWRLKAYPNAEDHALSARVDLTPATIALLRSRSVVGEKQIYDFLNPSLRDLPDPYLFSDMNKVVNRLLKAKQQNEQITIYGDYDADGVTATAVMYKGLQRLGFKHLNTYIPNRFDEGYGLNSEALDELIHQNTQLLITVDCGISAIEEAEKLKAANVDLIITDHHQPGETYPNAFALINPHCRNSQYPFAFLAGVGVAFEVIRALSQQLLPDWNLVELLPLVAIGTVGDVVPMKNVNRILTRAGMEAINQGRSPGIRALAEASGLAKITSTTQIAYQIVPKLNASGRMAHADSALYAMLAEKEEAQSRALELERYNQDRKRTELVIQEAAMQQWQAFSESEKQAAAFLFYDPKWHHGVLGIVASRLSEMLQAPVFVCADDNDIIRGSGRAPQGFNLHRILTEMSDAWLKYGGHAQAAGISFAKDRLTEVRQRLLVAAQIIQSTLLIEDVTVADIELDNEIDLVQQQQEWSRLEPFGPENEEPLVLLRGVQVLNIKSLTQGLHLQMQFQFGPRRYQAFAWRNGESIQEFQGVMDLLVKLQVNAFRGREEFRLEIIDWRTSRLIGNDLLQKIRSTPQGHQFIFHSPESRTLLAESGLLLENLPSTKVSEQFPFLPEMCYSEGIAAIDNILLDPPLCHGVDQIHLYDPYQVTEWKQSLYWLLPDRVHLTSWYRWLKSNGQNYPSFQDYRENPGNLSTFLAEIAVRNTVYLLQKAGLVEETKEGLIWLDTNGVKVDLTLIPEYRLLQEKREELLAQCT
jgi:single-stranded-DNA-specific exonuclease